MDYDFDQHDDETNLLRQKLNQLIEKGSSTDMNFLSDTYDNDHSRFHPSAYQEEECKG